MDLLSYLRKLSSRTYQIQVSRLALYIDADVGRASITTHFVDGTTLFVSATRSAISYRYNGAKPIRLDIEKASWTPFVLPDIGTIVTSVGLILYEIGPDPTTSPSPLTSYAKLFVKAPRKPITKLELLTTLLYFLARVTSEQNLGVFPPNLYRYFDLTPPSNTLWPSKL